MTEEMDTYLNLGVVFAYVHRMIMRVTVGRNPMQ